MLVVDQVISGVIPTLYWACMWAFKFMYTFIMRKIALYL